MRCLPVLSFVGGVWLLQQSASLPSSAELAMWFAFLLALKLLILISKPHLAQRLSTQRAEQLNQALTRLWVLLLALCLGLSYATWRAEIRLHERLSPAMQGKPIQLIGVVASLPQKQPQAQRFEFDVERALNSPYPMPKHVSLTQYLQPQFPQQRTIIPLDLHPGQRWLLTVKLKRPHGLSNPYARDSEAWALAHDIGASGSLLNVAQHLQQEMVWRPSYIVNRARDQIAQRMQKVLQGQAYLPVLTALAIGEDSAIESDDWQIFVNSGINHLMSISGLHITMLSGLLAYLVWAYWRTSAPLTLLLPARKASALAGACVAILYALLAGFSVPTQRTVYMLACFACAMMCQQQIQLARTLLLALLLVVLVDPWAVLAPGFYLSFGAVAGFLYALGHRLAQSNWLAAALRTQWVASVILLPLTIAMFQQISWISPLANALAIPVISLAVVPLTLCGAILPIDSALQLAHGLMAFCMHCLQALSVLPWSHQDMAPVGMASLLLAGVGVLVLFLPRGFPLKGLGVLMLLPMLNSAQAQLNKGAMQVTVLDVGQGLAVLVRTQQHQLLYDTGGVWAPQMNSGNRVIQPYLRTLGIDHLDAMVVSHHDTDHYGGMETLLHSLPTQTLLTSFDLPLDNGRLLQRNQRCEQGQSWQWDGVRFDVLFPDSALYQQAEVSDNNRSCVLRVVSNSGSILLTGDIEAWAERRLLQQAQSLSSDAMIIPHHGSKTSSSPSFIDAVSPHWAVATVGFRNRYHHPRADILQRYQQRDGQYFRSDWDGAVLMDFPAQASAAISVQAWRTSHARYWQDRESLAEIRPTR